MTTEIKEKAITKEDAFNLVYLALNKDDYDKTTKIIQALSLQDANIFLILANYAYDVPSYDALKAVLEQWEIYYDNGKTSFPFSIFLYTVDYLDTGILKLYKDEGSFLRYAVALLDVDDAYYRVKAFKRLFEVFGEQPAANYLTLFKLIADYNQSPLAYYQDISEYLTERFREFAVFQDKPDYILEKPGTSLYNKFGPANKPPDDNISENKYCLEGEGCHMLLCNHITDYADGEEKEENEDWFSGECDVCHIGIKKKAYALRRPLVRGGWLGCYCSKECLIVDVPKCSLEYPFIVNIIEFIVDEMGKYGLNDNEEK